MYQVKVLEDKVWKAALNDSVERGEVLRQISEYESNHVNLANYPDAADLYDFVQKEFYKKTEKEYAAVKLVKVTPSGRELEVMQFKELKRRK